MSITGNRMRIRRKALGMSADKVAEATGVSRSTIFRYENGEIDKVPGDFIPILAKALLTSPAYLMGWEEPDEKEADLLADIAGNPTLLSYAAKIKELDKEDQQKIYSYIDYIISTKK